MQETDKREREREIAEEVERKNAEMLRQEKLAHATKPIPEKILSDHDKAVADSFPASDPPPAP